MGTSAAFFAKRVEGWGTARLLRSDEGDGAVIGLLAGESSLSHAPVVCSQPRGSPLLMLEAWFAVLLSPWGWVVFGIGTGDWPRCR